MMIGISLRFALAVGLHLRNDDATASPFVKENLAHLWWSINSIESQVCALIGRPCIIPNDECTVPLPTAISERRSRSSVAHQLRTLPRMDSGNTTHSDESSSSETVNRSEPVPITPTSFLQARIKITIIMQRTLSKLYRPRISTKPWEQTHKEITTLTSELDEWVTAVLPGGFGLVDCFPEQGVQYERMLLSFHYYSARLLISRPSLCRLERRIQGQSHASALFNQKTAEACVQAAQAVTRLFPDQPNWMFICHQSPWWCIVHYMMQAIAVFLLEMSFQGTETTPNGEDLSKSTEKLVKWLRFMSHRNAVAERAYAVVMDIIVKTGAPHVQTDRSESESEPVVQEHTIPPIVATSAGARSATSLEVEQLTQGYGESQPDQSFLLDPALEMPPIFGSPFINDFDQFNLFNNTLFSDGHPIRQDARMWYANFSQEDHQDPPA
jgi:hypothetical protein